MIENSEERTALAAAVIARELALADGLTPAQLAIADIKSGEFKKIPMVTDVTSPRPASKSKKNRRNTSKASRKKNRR